MVNINRQISREDSHKGENDLIEMNSQRSKTSTNRQTSTDRQEVIIQMERLLKTHKLVKQKRSCGNSCQRTCLTIYLTLLGLCVLVLGLWTIKKEFVKQKDLVETSNEVNQSLHERQKIAGYAKLKGDVFHEMIQQEEYGIDTEQLFYNKEVHWQGLPGNEHIISNTSNNNGCVRMKTSGHVKVFNSISFKLEGQERFFHSVELRTENRRDVVRLASYSWSQPQTGRQPSTLQFLVQVKTGDELCLQTSNTSLIYAGHYDNSFLVEKIGR